MENRTLQKTQRKLGCREYHIVMIGVLLCFGFMASQCRARAVELDLTSGFDNGYVDLASPDKRYLEVLVTTPKHEHAGRRVPLNLALVIDKSGSMAREGKMKNVKQAALGMINRLRPGDRFSLIAYDNDAQILIPSEAMEGLYRARSLIKSLQAGGGTNLEAGLSEGIRQVRRYYSPDNINRVLLLSDGMANQGITSPGIISGRVYKQAERGISLSTFGVGLDFNEDLMAVLSESGRGMYYFIDHAENIQTILDKEFSSVEHLAAADIKITIELGAGLEIDKIFANNYQIQGNTINVRAGDLAAGELRRMQVRLRLPRLTAGEHRVGKVRMSYQLPGDKRIITATQDLRLTYLQDQTAIHQKRDQGVTERSFVFEAHTARSKAAAAVDQGDMASARMILDKAKRQLNAAEVQSKKVRREIRSVEIYAAELNKSLDRKAKASLQKKVKYRSYALEGC